MSPPENIWAYCDVCRETRPVNGGELREYLTSGSPHTYIDLLCSICFNVIATISIGPPDGTPPVDPPLHLPPPETTEPEAVEDPNSPLRRVHQIELRRQGECVKASIDQMEGTGAKLPDALRDLANVIEQSDLTIWVPVAASTFTEDGQLKAACPECGRVTTFGFDKVFAYVCEGCGLGIRVEE
jgi:hypothetical protein